MHIASNNLNYVNHPNPSSPRPHQHPAAPLLPALPEHPQHLPFGTAEASGLAGPLNPWVPVNGVDAWPTLKPLNDLHTRPQPTAPQQPTPPLRLHPHLPVHGRRELQAHQSHNKDDALGSRLDREEEWQGGAGGRAARLAVSALGV